MPPSARLKNIGEVCLIMKRTPIFLICAALVLFALSGCGEEDVSGSEYEQIMKTVCEVNNIPYLNESGTEDEGIYELILCGVVASGGEMGGIVLVPDDGYYAGYTWPWNGNDSVRFNGTVMFDEHGEMFDYSYEDELIGRHIILICKNIVAESYPGQLVGQRVTVVLDD